MENITFSEISKIVGFEGTERMPDKDVSVELLELVRGRNGAALTKVLKVYRFAPSPTNANEAAANAIICEALAEGRRLFS